MLLIVAIVAITIVLYQYFVTTRRRTQFRNSYIFDADVSPHLRISVVVSGMKERDKIAEMLQGESNSYEVIVVTDFGSAQDDLRKIVQHFKLFKASYLPSGELPDKAIRGVYRSHRRLYSKLLVVDSPASDHYSPFEVGAVVSSYDYNLQIRSQRTLRKTAIRDLLLELAMYPESSVVEIRSRIAEPIKLILREDGLPSVKKGNQHKGQHKIKIYYKVLN